MHLLSLQGWDIIYKGITQVPSAAINTVLMGYQWWLAPTEKEEGQTEANKGFW